MTAISESRDLSATTFHLSFFEKTNEENSYQDRKLAEGCVSPAPPTLKTSCHRYGKDSY